MHPRRGMPDRCGLPAACMHAACPAVVKSSSNILAGIHVETCFSYRACSYHRTRLPQSPCALEPPTLCRPKPGYFQTCNCMLQKNIKVERCVARESQVFCALQVPLLSGDAVCAIHFRGLRGAGAVCRFADLHLLYLFTPSDSCMHRFSYPCRKYLACGHVLNLLSVSGIL